MAVKRKTKSVRKSKDSNELNKTVMRAIVIQGDQNITKQQSNAIDGDRDSSTMMDSDLRYIQPPYDPEVLSMLPENSTELVQIIEAMEVNIEGFGQRVVRREMEDEFLKAHETEIKKEQTELKGLIEITNADDNMTWLRRKTRKDIETFGYGFWEVLTTMNGSLAGFQYIESKDMRLTKKDTRFTKVEKRYLDEDFNIITKTFHKKFRRFVQIIGNKKVYFKEWDDPRTIDKNTGEAISGTKMSKRAANGMVHFKIHSGRTPYGLPRIVGNLFSLFGSRASDTINFQTFKNNNVPSMIITVSNGMLTGDSVSRVEEFVNSQIKNSDNYSKFLILEAETQDEEAQQSGAMKIDIKPMTESQRDDQLFQKYDENNAEKIRRAFRLPGIFIGKTDNLNRATSDSARRLADEQVFSPERTEMDRKVNSILMHFGFKYHTIKSNSPNVTDDGALTKVLSGAEKSGALTPNLAREIVGEILNQELEPIIKTDKFDPSIPFSLTMAEAVKKRDGIAPNQGQLSGDPIDDGEPDPNTEDDKTDEDDDKTEKNVIDSFFEYMSDDIGEFDDDINIDIFAEG